MTIEQQHPLRDAVADLTSIATMGPEKGAWRVTVSSVDLRPLVEVVIRQYSGSVLLVAGEDRPNESAIYAHYLVSFCPKDEERNTQLLHIATRLDRESPAVPSLAGLSFPASRFEREMRDVLGIQPTGHPDPRPLVRHGFWPETFYPLRHGAVLPDFHDDGRPFPFTEVEGDGVYEIPVGPVHAGVIEPGHFRFNVLGETILKMRARLYFTHKGTERLLLGRHPIDALPLVERVSGDTSVAHAVAFCQAVEALADVGISKSAAAARVVLLELERLYNHVADVGAIIADTGFPVGQAHCLRLREDLLRVNKEIAGHRLLRGVVVPGGVIQQRALESTVVAAVGRIVRDFEEVVQICRENTLVADRLEGTGRLPTEVARDFGVVGYVARACGLPHDARADLPSGAYRWLNVTSVVANTGDVEARLDVRVREVRQAFEIIRQAISGATSAVDCRVEVGPLPPWTAAFGVVEAWRGRLAHMVMADDEGRLHRVKIVDPSFFNWPALARALDGNIVPDFPLCNKSFNASYSGNDL